METAKAYLSIALLGHVDSGKSTTLGHLLYIAGVLVEKPPQSDTLKYWNVYNWKKKDETIKCKFILATIDHPDEKLRGITIHRKLRYMESQRYRLTVIDTPGHIDFLKNMIIGTSQADAVIVVVSVVEGELQAGFACGNLKQHLRVAFGLGIKSLVVAINKMDHSSVQYSQVLFDEAVKETQKMLSTVGYKPEQVVAFIPISSLQGDNLSKPSEKMPWYHGPSLIGAIDSIDVTPQDTTRPLRLAVSQVFKISGVGTVLIGRVESGIVKKEMQVVIEPGHHISTVKSIERNHEDLQQASTGLIVAIHLKQIDAKSFTRRWVVSEASNMPTAAVTSFIARLLIMDHPNQIAEGYSPVVYCRTGSVVCKFARLVRRLDKTGGIAEEQPRSVKKGQLVVAQLVPKKPLCVELFKEFASFGRLLVYDSKVIVAVGMVIEVARQL